MNEKLKKLKPYMARYVPNIPLPKEPKSVDILAIEMRRAGYSEDEIRIEKKVEYILELGKKNTIRPCHDCPAFNPHILCNERDKIGLSTQGALISPRGNIITLHS